MALYIEHPTNPKNNPPVNLDKTHHFEQHGDKVYFYANTEEFFAVWSFDSDINAAICKNRVVKTLRDHGHMLKL